MASYPYKSLDVSKNEIRILKILGSVQCMSTPEIVQVTIENVSLDSLLPHLRTFTYSEEPPFSRKSSPPDCSQVDSWRPYVEAVRSAEFVESLDINLSRLPEMPSLHQGDELLINPHPMDLTTLTPNRIPSGSLSSIPHRFTWGDFEAVSYCWESDVREKEVLVDDIIVQVPNDLELMLRKLQDLPEAQS
jgi:hypothetical protein